MPTKKYTTKDWEEAHNKSLGKGIGYNASIVASDATLAKRRADQLKVLAQINAIRRNNDIPLVGEQ
jgi:hypothetical protein